VSGARSVRDRARLVILVVRACPSFSAWSDLHTVPIGVQSSLRRLITACRVYTSYRLVGIQLRGYHSIPPSINRPQSPTPNLFPSTTLTGASSTPNSRPACNTVPAAHPCDPHAAFACAADGVSPVRVFFHASWKRGHVLGQHSTARLGTGSIPAVRETAPARLGMSTRSYSHRSRMTGGGSWACRCVQAALTHRIAAAVPSWSAGSWFNGLYLRAISRSCVAHGCRLVHSLIWRVQYDDSASSIDDSPTYGTLCVASRSPPGAESPCNTAQRALRRA